MSDEPITFLDRARESYQSAVHCLCDADNAGCREELQFATTAALVSIAESLARLTEPQSKAIGVLGDLWYATRHCGSSACLSIDVAKVRAQADAIIRTAAEKARGA